MKDKDTIPIETFCAHYKVPVTFIHSLQKYELLEIIRENNVEYIQITQLQRVEKMIRLHYELNINMEGLDVVNNLLGQLMELQEENRILRDRLKLFE
ncbi:MAG TPA: chaperone modulator CbpM [Cyclobacteriaceae bacterium]|nr:chaperone modulator CbpM [Cyclobacteriaceae bacterium]MCB9236433.1 chaperone modulator CbpM [Flammeovirgaceae bacterium]MCB0499355.1 chaperone modulator CbpM [Cyclobacteriaceae bacterium]MCO5272248.1 chaperone modulator CbpM [Cyclobacteriaceae bacterium]MCW5902106.1 chaperone modulator CbpM [Cyclobacteriaceae bacterium]